MVVGIASKFKWKNIIKLHINRFCVSFNAIKFRANCNPPSLNILSNAPGNQNVVCRGRAEGWILFWRFEGYFREGKSSYPGFAFWAGAKVGIKISRTGETQIYMLSWSQSQNLQGIFRTIPKIAKEFRQLFPKFSRNFRKLFLKKPRRTVGLAIRYQGRIP